MRALADEGIHPHGGLLFDIYAGNQLVAYAQAGLPWDITRQGRVASSFPHEGQCLIQEVV